MILIALCFIAACAGWFYLGALWCMHRWVRALRSDPCEAKLRAIMHAEGWARVFIVSPCSCKRCSAARQDAASVN